MLISHVAQFLLPPLQARPAVISTQRSHQAPCIIQVSPQHRLLSSSPRSQMLAVCLRESNVGSSGGDIRMGTTFGGWEVCGVRASLSDPTCLISATHGHMRHW